MKAPPLRLDQLRCTWINSSPTVFSARHALIAPASFRRSSRSQSWYRSCSLMPPHTPCAWRVRSANARHRGWTWHRAQICFASAACSRDRPDDETGKEQIGVGELTGGGGPPVLCGSHHAHSSLDPISSTRHAEPADAAMRRAATCESDRPTRGMISASRCSRRSASSTQPIRCGPGQARLRLSVPGLSPSESTGISQP